MGEWQRGEQVFVPEAREGNAAYKEQFSPPSQRRPRIPTPAQVEFATVGCSDLQQVRPTMHFSRCLRNLPL